jgi:serine/threonine-protein kinase
MQVESLGRYRIEQELGRGAMGRVFLAYDPEIDRRVAIKTIQIFSALPAGERSLARERFLREARSAGKLLHPGIVTIFDVGESEGMPYLAMEFVEGETLDAFCREDDLLPVAQVVALVLSAADALGFAHERGIVHRDIKPANLMRVGDRAVKIMDFGLAKSATSSMTNDGALLGTPNYMSPEQVRGEALDGRADLFSLAVVCWEMITGVKPFGGDSMSSVLYRIVHEPPRETSLPPNRMTAALAGFFRRALAKHPAERLADAAAFSAALRAAASSSTGEGAGAGAASIGAADRRTPSFAEETSAEPAGRSARIVWIVLGSIALAAAGWGGAAWLTRSAPAPVLMLEARVRTEPAGLPVRLNGQPLSDDRLRFAAGGPFGVVAATSACRETKHRIGPEDAGREIVLVLDPTQADVTVDPGITGAQIEVNDRPAGVAPATVRLDLCQDNTIAVTAPGFQAATATIVAGATPLAARSAAGAIALTAVPIGRLLLPSTRLPVEFFVDGKPAKREAGGIEVPAGSHEVRAANAEHFVDVTTSLTVPAGGSASPVFSIPGIARLVVQTFPPNCRVWLRRGSGEWRELGETPLRYELAAGRYGMKVESPLSGESREQEISLAPGANPPVRVSFGRSGR